MAFSPWPSFQRQEVNEHTEVVPGTLLFHVKLDREAKTCRDRKVSFPFWPAEPYCTPSNSFVSVAIRPAWSWSLRSDFSAVCAPAGRVRRDIGTNVTNGPAAGCFAGCPGDLEGCPAVEDRDRQGTDPVVKGLSQLRSAPIVTC